MTQSGADAKYDLVIRRGTVFDGTGAAAFEGDIAVKDGRIADIGKVVGGGREEIDAKGQIVTPGFVDIHTHFDGQVSWDPYLAPSSIHGVTTAIMGNCGVGFAPCAPDRHDWLIGLMEGVEDIPGTALAEGITWGWESFPQFMDTIGRKPLAVDVGMQVPHGALRGYVMGDRAARLEPASANDTKRMASLAKEAILAGALGFSTSRTYKHRDKQGRNTPSYKAERDELWGIARAVGETGKGVIQLIADFFDFDDEFPLVRGMAEVSGRPLSMTIEQDDRHPDIWRRVLAGIKAGADAGLDIKGQVPPRPTGLIMGLTATLNPFILYPTFRSLGDMPTAEKAKILSSDDFRRRLLADTVAYPDGELITFILTSFHKMFALGDPPNYEPHPDTSAAAIAGREGRDPRAVVLDMLTANEGKGLIFFPIMNYLEGNLDFVREMMTHERSLFGLSDAGAHCGIISDGSFPTTILAHWGRDRSRGARLPLEWLVRKQTMETARHIGLHDRGVIAPGLRADLNVIDFDRLTLHAPEIVHDLPAGGKRFMQRADGYTATVVAGQITVREGRATGALPGRLVRGPQGQPRAQAAE